MNLISKLHLSILIYQIFFISSIIPVYSLNEEKSQQFNAVYRIDSKEKGYPLMIQKNKVNFSTKKGGKEQNFKIAPTGSNFNSYYIIAKPFNKKIGINEKDEISLIDINDNTEKTRWNFIKINDKEFLLQNSFNKKYLEIRNRKEGKNTIYYAICSSDLKGANDKANFDKISNTFRYSFFKLCDEVKLKTEHIEIIDKEPVDILIKYIDLTDRTLNREGITQITKDKDNEELRYSVRSILQNIPWIRKIFILMPNERVKYFKPISEISGKFVYVKDKDIIGFDSASSVAFQLNLLNMTKFGLSDNFILIDDDYFFGKPIKKSDFFYYDEEQKKVVPSVVTDDFSEMVKTEIINEYNKLFKRKNTIKPHTFNGWKVSQLAAYKLLLENYDFPLINAGFSHNAIALNIHDLKEIHELIINKYQYANQVLKAKIRTVFDLQPQSLFNSFMLNIKKRRVNTIPNAYYDVAFLDGKNFDIELFVLNTSGDRKYSDNHYKKSKNILEKKFPIPTPFETDVTMVKTVDGEKSIDLSQYVKISEFNDLKKKLEEAEKNKKELNNKINEIIKSKDQLEKSLKEEINYILKNIHEISNNTLNYSKDYNLTMNNQEINHEELFKFYNFFKSLFKIIIVIILLSICILFFYYYSKSKYKNNEPLIENNQIQMANLLKTDESFSKLSTEEKY